MLPNSKSRAAAYSHTSLQMATADAAIIAIYLVYENKESTIHDVKELVSRERLLPILQTFAALCSGLRPDTSAGRAAKCLYEFVYDAQLLDGSESAASLGMKNFDCIYVFPLHDWCEHPERLLYDCASSDELAARRSMTTLFYGCRAIYADETPRCAASMRSSVDERLQLHLHEPCRIAEAVHAEYLDVTRCHHVPKAQLSRKQREGVQRLDLHTAMMAANSIAIADVFAAFDRREYSLRDRHETGPGASAPVEEPLGATGWGVGLLCHNGLLHEIHGVLSSVAPTFYVASFPGATTFPGVGGRRPLVLPPPPAAPPLPLRPPHAATASTSTAPREAPAAAYPVLQRSHATDAAAALSLDDSLGYSLCWRRKDRLAPAAPPVDVDVHGGSLVAFRMAAEWRCQQAQEQLLAQARAMEDEALNASRRARHVAFKARTTAYYRQTTREERLLQSLYDSIDRPLGFDRASDASLSATWRQYEQLRPMTPLRHWLLHGRLPLADGRCLLLETGIATTESLVGHLSDLPEACPLALDAPLTPAEFQVAATTMTTLRPPALLVFGSTCRKLHAATSTERARLRMAVEQLRKLCADFKLAPVAMRHAVGLNWRASKRAAGSVAALPLVGVRCARLAGLLHECRSLFCLALSDCGLTDAALTSLLVPLGQNRLPRLSVLRLDHNLPLTDSGAAALASVMRPPCVHCGRSFTVGELPASQGSFPVRRGARDPCPSCGQPGPRLDVPRDAIPLLRLRSLEIDGCGMGDAGVEALTAALAGFDSRVAFLTHIALGSEQTGEAGASAVARAVEAGALRHAVEQGCARLQVSGRFSRTRGEGFEALTSACKQRRVLLQLDGIPIPESAGPEAWVQG